MSGKIGTLKNYIIITPCKNEGGNLSSLINSIALQTVKPKLWVIVDDGSTDNTPEIIKHAAKSYKWIKNIRLEDHVRDLGVHLANVMKKGFDYAVSYCNLHRIEFYYLGNLDGDLTLSPTFYENLLKQFENDSMLGVASGGTKHIIGNRVVHAKLSVDEPSGGHMLIRKKCFEECGGIPLTYAVDSVIKAKARIKGWRTRRFEDNVAIEIRDVSAAEGYWKGFIHKGEIYYYLNHNPLHVAMKIIKYSFRRPYYIGIAFLVGYIGSIAQKNERIEDMEIRRYYWNKWKIYL